MLDAVIRYLSEANVPFRLTSRPSAERMPRSAYRAPRGGVLLETKIVYVGGSPVIACFPAGERPDHAALGNVMKGPVLEGGTEQLPELLRHAAGNVPPLGKLFGLPLVVDARVQQSGVILFRAFGDDDLVEMAYDDFARLEQPRVFAFAFGGELGARATSDVQHR